MKSQDAFRLNVRDLMGRQGLRVKDLADMVGLSPSYLSLILSGERANLSDLHKDAIALALGTTVAELYIEPPAPEASAPRTGPRVEPAQIARVARDIAPFEDFIRALNVDDRLFLAAFYRGLNALSDEDVRKMGAMMRNVLAWWQESAASRSAGAAPATPAAQTSSLGPDARALLWLTVRLEPAFGDVPFSYLASATSWPPERLHRALGEMESAGLAAPVSKAPLLMRPSSSASTETASRWVPASRRAEFLLSLAKAIDPESAGAEAGSAPASECLAELYLEGGDLRKARYWYEQAAGVALAGGMWRLAKDRLLVVNSLDTILETPPDQRVPAVQMLATTCLNLGETDEALAYQEKSIVHWERAGSRTDLVLALLMAASISARRREWPRALQYLDRALAASSGDDSAEARVRLGLASILSDRGQLTRTREEYERAMLLAGNAHDESITAQALMGLGKVFYWRRDFKRSLQHLNRALSLAGKREAVLEALIHIEIGKVRFEEGGLAVARDHFSKASKAAEGLKSPEAGNLSKAWLSRCVPRGSVLPDLESKRALARSARTYFAGSGDSQGLVFSLIALAEAEEALDSPVAAAEAFQEALHEAREYGNPGLEGAACDAFAASLERRSDELAPVLRERARWARAKIR